MASVASLAISNLLAREGIRKFYQESRYLRTTDMSRDSVYQDGTYNSGNTVNYRLPWLPATSNVGNNLLLQGPQESTIPITVYQFNQAASLTLNLKTTVIPEDEFADRVSEPMAQRLKRDIELFLIKYAAIQSTNLVGTPGTQLSSNQVIADMKATLQTQLIPSESDVHAAISPFDQAALFGSNQSLFNPASKISDFYDDGETRNIYGVNLYSTNNVPSIGIILAAGLGTPVTGTVPAGGATIPVTGMTGSVVIPAGTKFTIAGVNTVDPETKFDTGRLQVFTVNNGLTFSQFGMPTFNDVTASGGAVAALPISPPIIGSAGGMAQTVSIVPTSGTAITFFGAGLDIATPGKTSYRIGFGYHRLGVQVASVPLAGSMQKGVTASERDAETGMSMLGSHQYIIGATSDAFGMSTLIGTLSARPQWTCVLASL